MKANKFEEASNRHSLPIMAWEFHCEYVRELKAVLVDLKKVKKISDQFAWNEVNLDIKDRIQDEVVLVTDLDLKIIFASSKIKRMTGYK